MPYPGLYSFIKRLEKMGELKKISEFADPVLEIPEITDRISKSGGPALLFENTGTQFPLLINAFGSDKRIALALGKENLDEVTEMLERLFKTISGPKDTITSKLSLVPQLFRLSGVLPKKTTKKGQCQRVIIKDPDLGILPVLKCWPFDGGRFITLPIVNTFHPETGKTNAGMYRMQVLDRNTTAMHWQLHKTGANHFNAWKKAGKIMPVSVALGGDPLYTYAATAPLPENVDEYILAGLIRGRRVRLVKCITNDIYVPDDADIVLEGYVDPTEDMVWEGPFGDHTGFYSLADWYPRFHVTCITHSGNPVYPATIVGIPPQEDAFLARASEKIFLIPIRLALLPEAQDLHMPDAGVAHNLAIVRISKSYPGQGMKTINSLLGAGQMMFSKYLVVVDGDTDIRNYGELLKTIFLNTDFRHDILFCKGPLDVLDHASDTFAFGGKAGIDATLKISGERVGEMPAIPSVNDLVKKLQSFCAQNLICDFNPVPVTGNQLLLIISVQEDMVPGTITEIAQKLGDTAFTGVRLVIVVDSTVDIRDLFMVAWQALGNTDPVRDHYYISGETLLLDATVKIFGGRGFPRKWPNIVCSSEETIAAVDKRWNNLGFNELIASPSAKYGKLRRKGNEEICP